MTPQELQRFWQPFGQPRQWVTVATLTTPEQLANGERMVAASNGSDPARQAHADPYRLARVV